MDKTTKKINETRLLFENIEILMILFIVYKEIPNNINRPIEKESATLIGLLINIFSMMVRTTNKINDNNVIMFE